MVEGSMTREWTRPASQQPWPRPSSRAADRRAHTARSHVRATLDSAGARGHVSRHAVVTLSNVSCGVVTFLNTCRVMQSHFPTCDICHHALEILANMLSLLMKLVMSNV